MNYSTAIDRSSLRYHNPWKHDYYGNGSHFSYYQYLGYFNGTDSSFLPQDAYYSGALGHIAEFDSLSTNCEESTHYYIRTTL